jgi:hypothetical protein
VAAVHSLCADGCVAQVGIPAFFLAVLLYIRPNMSQLAVRAQFGFLFAGYRKETWFFEMVGALRCAHAAPACTLRRWPALRRWTCCTSCSKWRCSPFSPRASSCQRASIASTAHALHVFSDRSRRSGMVAVTLYLMVILNVNPYIRHVRTASCIARVLANAGTRVQDDDRVQKLCLVELYLLLLAGNILYYSPVQCAATRVLVAARARRDTMERVGAVIGDKYDWSYSLLLIAVTLVLIAYFLLQCGRVRAPPWQGSAAADAGGRCWWCRSSTECGPAGALRAAPRGAPTTCSGRRPWTSCVRAPRCSRRCAPRSSSTEKSTLLVANP